MFFNKGKEDSSLMTRVIDNPKEIVPQPAVEKPLTFEQWKEDIEERLAKHLFRHPEIDSPQLQEVGNVSNSFMFIRVEESVVTKGLWLVYKNGVIQKQFQGILAQRDATAYANYLINGLK